MVTSNRAVEQTEPKYTYERLKKFRWKEGETLLGIVCSRDRRTFIFYGIFTCLRKSSRNSGSILMLTDQDNSSSSVFEIEEIESIQVLTPALLLRICNKAARTREMLAELRERQLQLWGSL